MLVVIVIIGIIAGISIIGYTRVRSNMRNSLSTTRIMQYAEAQNKFRTIRGRRRYASFAELCQEGLLAASVVKLDASCNQTAIAGWVIVPGTETPAFLANNFFAVLRFETRPNGETSPIYCISSDGVLRKSAPNSLDICTINSAPVEP